MRLTLRARILAVYLVALVASLAALGYGLVRVRGIGAELTRVQELWLPLSQQITELRHSFPDPALEELEQQPPRVRRIIAQSRIIGFRRAGTLVQAAQADATAGLRTAQAGGPAPARMTELVSTLGRLTEPSNAIEPAIAAYVDALDRGDPAKAQEEKQRILALDRQIDDVLKRASESVGAGLRADAAAARAKSQSSLFALAALTVLATGFGLVAILIVGRALSPVGELIAGAKRISAGDFDREIEIDSVGTEIAALAAEFNTMAASLRSRDERLRLLAAFNENVLESIRVGILVAGENGTISGMNRSAEEIWGVARSEVMGKALSAVAEAAGREGSAVLDRVESVRAGGAPVRLGAVEFANARMVEVSAAPFLEQGRGGTAERNGVVVVAEDVTERVRVERALLRSERLAAIGRMSSQITHEVRNPLNSLSLNVEMLEEELAGQDGEPRALLRAIAKEIERLTQITEGYLGFARLPKPRLEREQVNALVDSLVRFVREEAEKSNVRLSIDLGESVPEVLADENQLRQAMLNVVRNALEALGSGERKGGTISVSTRRTGSQVEVVFRDDGPGIVPKDLARIFDPFHSTKPDGTGLGLPLTQQIIEEHGGTIACASEPGRGTVFTIRLPAA